MMLTWEQFMIPVLRVLSDGEKHMRLPLYEEVADLVGLTAEDRSEINSVSGQHTYHNRIGWSISDLCKAQAIHIPHPGSYIITDNGRKILSDYSQGITKKELQALPEYQNWRASWLYAPGSGASMWEQMRDNGIIAIGWDFIGDLSQYKSKRDVTTALIRETGDQPKNSALACWQFQAQMQPGDIIYVKKGTKQIIAYGIVTSDYKFDESRAEYKNIRTAEWHQLEEPITVDLNHNQKTLTKLSFGTVLLPRIENAFNDAGIDIETDNDTDDVNQEVAPDYTDNQFLSDVYVSQEDLDDMKALLHGKKNLILQGSPGTGKTYAAKRLAYIMLGSEDDSRIEFTQFHQNTTYDDFVYGYRPTGDGGFVPMPGLFTRFCERAQEDSDNPYVFIIDEINRANISKVFGELLMCIEADHREDKVALNVTGGLFFVPKNVYIIGMMNTADRGLALIDYALRRRFAFFEMTPSLDNEVFRAQHNITNGSPMYRLINAVKTLNERIDSDMSLGSGFMIGHSYFCGAEADPVRIVRYELAPLLREYWFDQPETAKDEISKLERAVLK